MKKRKSKAVFDLAARAALRVLDAYMKALTDDELKSFDRAAQDLSETNCWFAVHQIKPLLVTIIEHEIWLRAPRKRSSVRETTMKDNRPFLGLRDPKAPITASCDNVIAWRLGEACREAARADAGDLIDRGLALLKQLEAHGFAVIVHPSTGGGDSND